MESHACRVTIITVAATAIAARMAQSPCQTAGASAATTTALANDRRNASSAGVTETWLMIANPAVRLNAVTAAIPTTVT